MNATHLAGYGLVICSTTIEAFGQIALKKTASAGSGEGIKFGWLSAGVACYAVEAVVWTLVLQCLNVSIAYPMGSLSFVMIVLMSKLILQEKVEKERWLGVSLILCGTAMLGLNS